MRPMTTLRRSRKSRKSCRTVDVRKITLQICPRFPLEPWLYNPRFELHSGACFMKRLIQSVLVSFFIAGWFIPAAWSEEKVDLETIGRIRYEGFRDSKVMEFASGLMDSIGARLTGSPNMKRANEWTRDQFTAMGLTNAHLEAWGPFGRGWANQYVNVRMITPDLAPLLAYAKAWTPGTNGVLQGKCLRVN